nr:hypothetical protein Iba_chr15cCG7120 [Ipomoea batatas]
MELSGVDHQGMCEDDGSSRTWEVWCAHMNNADISKDVLALFEDLLRNCANDLDLEIFTTWRERKIEQRTSLACSEVEDRTLGSGVACGSVCFHIAKVRFSTERGWHDHFPLLPAWRNRLRGSALILIPRVVPLNVPYPACNASMGCSSTKMTRSVRASDLHPISKSTQRSKTT